MTIAAVGNFMQWIEGFIPESVRGCPRRTNRVCHRAATRIIETYDGLLRGFIDTYDAPLRAHIEQIRHQPQRDQIITNILSYLHNVAVHPQFNCEEKINQTAHVISSIAMKILHRREFFKEADFFAVLSCNEGREEIRDRLTKKVPQWAVNLTEKVLKSLDIFVGDRLIQKLIAEFVYVGLVVLSYISFGKIDFYKTVQSCVQEKIEIKTREFLQQFMGRLLQNNFRNLPTQTDAVQRIREQMNSLFDILVNKYDSGRLYAEQTLNTAVLTTGAIGAISVIFPAFIGWLCCVSVVGGSGVVLNSGIQIRRRVHDIYRQRISVDNLHTLLGMPVETVRTTRDQLIQIAKDAIDRPDMQPLLQGACSMMRISEDPKTYFKNVIDEVMVDDPWPMLDKMMPFVTKVIWDLMIANQAVRPIPPVVIYNNASQAPSQQISAGINDDDLQTPALPIPEATSTQAPAVVPPVDAAVLVSS